MGTRVAPAYANIFMGCFEQLYISNDTKYRENIVIYKKFIDDLFIIWMVTRGQHYCLQIRSIGTTGGVKLTPKFSKQTLDIVISQVTGAFYTSTHFKTVDTNSYIDFKNKHYRKWKLNIPYGQFRRIRKNCTLDATFEKQAQVIWDRFERKGYPKLLIKEAYEKARCLSQEDFLRKVPPEGDVPDIRDVASLFRDAPIGKSFSTSFITTFSDAHPVIRKIFNNRWFMLQNDPIL